MAGQGREVEFNLVEPGAALGGVLHLEASGQLFGQGRRQAVVKRAQRMRVEVILHQADFLGLGVAGRQALHELGILALGALRPYLVEALAGERLDGGQHAATAVLGVGVMFFGRLALLTGSSRLRGQPFDGSPSRKQGRSSKQTTGKRGS